MTANRTSFKPGPSVRRHRFTAEERRRGGVASAGNLVPMARGDDPRRHRLTAAECAEGGRKGFQSLMENRPQVLLWLKKKLKKQGRIKSRKAS